MIRNAGARKVMEYAGEHDFTIAGIANMVKKGIEEGVLCEPIGTWAAIRYIASQTGLGVTEHAVKKALGSLRVHYSIRGDELKQCYDVYDVAPLVGADELPDDTNSLALMAVLLRRGYMCTRPAAMMALLGFEPAGKIKIGDMCVERFVRVRTPKEAFELIEQCGGYWPRKRKW